MSYPCFIIIHCLYVLGYGTTPHEVLKDVNYEIKKKKNGENKKLPVPQEVSQGLERWLMNKNVCCF